MQKINLTQTNTKNLLRRKCVECNNIFESTTIICPECGSKKTTCAFTETERSEKLIN